MATRVVFADKPETLIRKSPSTASNVRVVNHVLLGTWLKVIDEDGDFFEVVTRKAGTGGWVQGRHQTDTGI